MEISTKIADYLGKTIQCECGKTHTMEIESVEIYSGALERVAWLVRKDGFSKPFVVADYNTHKVAGQRLLSLLEKEQISFSSYVFPETELVPDERALGKLLVNYDSDCDLIIGVGSGTINDVSRFFSFRMGLPYYIVATAPSMDGYASSVAPLIKNNLKTTFECQMPRAIIGDLDIISNAPPEMIAAGFGDVIGKYTCLADWELSAIINEEYYCERVAEMTRKSLERTIGLREGIAKGDREAIGGLMESLVLSGIGMSYVGNSRPASGSEHHLSHFWEMRFLLQEKEAVLHGVKVGIATVLIVQLYKFLREEGLETETIRQRTMPSVAGWEDKIRQSFLAAAPEVLLLEEQVQKNSPKGWQQRMDVIAQRWAEIQKVLSTVPSHTEVAGLISAIGGAVTPQEVGIDQELVRLGLLYAKEIRPRYTILQLLWDLNLLSDYILRLLGE